MKKIYFLLIALLSFVSVNAQIINFPDANFKAKLLAASPSNTIAKDLSGNYFTIDSNYDGQIQNSEALQVGYLDVSFSNITDLTGIEFFYKLTLLGCASNQLTSLDVSKNTSLIVLYCGSNQLTSLDLSNNTLLEELYCGYSQLTSLNLKNLVNLRSLNCIHNLLTTLNLKDLVNLEVLYGSNNQIVSLELGEHLKMHHLDCSFNSITTLDLSGLSNRLEEIICNNNLLTTLDFSKVQKLFTLNCALNQISELNLKSFENLASLDCSDNPIESLDFNEQLNLVYLYCSKNKLTNLDINKAANLQELICDDNPLLKTVFIKNGYNESILSFSNNPSLEYICADDSQLSQIQNLITEYGYTNCHVNTYCSFTPNGEFYTINGTTKFDKDNNGCDSSDLSSPNLKFNITDGNTTGNLISDATGNYSISVPFGVYNISPVLENPSYFIISPSNIVVDFPTQTSPFTQDFCITPNGSHSDIEVSIIPVEEARPGFDAKYKIIYKNKGNQIESGNISLNFDDAKIDFVSANATPTQSTGSLTWNYINLQPFETKIIDVVFNINSPMETPAVNGGDVLSYTTIITSGNSDEMPNDNIFTLNQTVVNSFDPNDITCLEGAKVSTSKIGDYVHYMIRFENTGSANATNIVVKDVVDAAKYDVNSIVPLNGSHDFYTRINGNNVEFIFENINLPFADATNDGYVAFKIKTKSTLVTGDSFSKNANIYFDYNFPIVTNTATTTIAALSNQDFEFKNYFKLYPNPVVNTLTIETKDVIEISSINIYNTLGQLVLVIPNSQNIKTVDLSSLTSGNYFIKINSDKGTSNTKFVKN